MATAQQREKRRDERSTATRPRSPLPSYYSKRAHDQARNANDDDELFGAAYEEGARDEAERSKALPSPKGAPKPTGAKPPRSPRARNTFTAAANTGTGVASIGAPFMIECGIIAINEIVNEGRAPLPSRFIAAFVLFGGLSMARGAATQPAAVFGWGIVIATFYAGTSKKSGGALGALKFVGDFMGGKYGKPGSFTPTGGPSSSAPGGTAANGAPEAHPFVASPGQGRLI